MIKRFVSRIDPRIGKLSGKVFYSGRDAYRKTNDLYLIGFNPGGNPAEHSQETVQSHTIDVLNSLPARWSAYCDESWPSGSPKGNPPGTYGMQPRVLHMLSRLCRDPRNTPSSNLIFVRSKREANLSREEIRQLADLCWPFHQEVIRVLRPRVIVCFGKTTGISIRGRLSANHHAGQFVENNERRWTSEAHLSDEGIAVVTMTHPSIADWTKSVTDPTPLVQQMLERS